MDFDKLLEISFFVFMILILATHGRRCTSSVKVGHITERKLYGLRRHARMYKMNMNLKPHYVEQTPYDPFSENAMCGERGQEARRLLEGLGVGIMRRAMFRLSQEDGGEADSLLDQDEAPWVVMVKTTVEKPREETTCCHGVIISPTWVLTAAKCIRDLRGKIVFESYDVGSKIWQFTANTQYLVYPGEDGVVGNGDVAVVHLNRPFDREARVRPACLPLDTARPSYEDCYLAMWNMETCEKETVSKNARKVKLKFVSEEWATVEMKALDPKQTGRALPLDIGAPVTCSLGGVQILVGTLSSYPPAWPTKGTSAIFMHVRAYIKWMRTVMREIETS